ncbi:MAG: hypothetical protein GY721_12355, partial [Deltaproteobacteria bacterium]|nr:hypothetical protein [Deltaproteobacteria bacterium]
MIDTFECCISLGPKRIQKLHDWWERHKEEDSILKLDLLRMTGYMVSAMQVLPMALVWAGPLYEKVRGSFKGRTLFSQEVKDTVKSFIDEVSVQKASILKPVQATHPRGDATERQVGALLYEGRPPYASPTMVQGRVVEEAKSEAIPEDYTTIAEMERWLVLWAVQMWYGILKNKSVSRFMDNQNAFLHMEGG